MVIDKLENAIYYLALGNRFRKAFEYLISTDLNNIAPGKYPIDGDNIVAHVSEYATKEIEDAWPEAHHKHIDVQYMIKGEEYMGYAPFEDQEVLVEYDEAKDLVFYKADTDYVLVSEGMFAVFAPSDIHAPGIKVDESDTVKKVVIKIKIGL